jgi:hypothetical protein
MPYLSPLPPPPLLRTISVNVTIFICLLSHNKQAEEIVLYVKISSSCYITFGIQCALLKLKMEIMRPIIWQAT